MLIRYTCRFKSRSNERACVRHAGSFVPLTPALHSCLSHVTVTALCQHMRVHVPCTFHLTPYDRPYDRSPFPAQFRLSPPTHCDVLPLFLMCSQFFSHAHTLSTPYATHAHSCRRVRWPRCRRPPPTLSCMSYSTSSWRRAWRRRCGTRCRVGGMMIGAVSVFVYYLYPCRVPVTGTYQLLLSRHATHLIHTYMGVQFCCRVQIT